MSLLNALQHRSNCSEDPFLHWTIDRPFNDQVLQEAASAVIPKIPRVYDGTRAGDMGGGAVKARCYIDRENVSQFPGFEGLIAELMSWETIDTVAQMLRRKMDGAYLRVEVIADREGFWLAPHKDIKEKLMSMLLYVNPFNESENLGTDFYDASMKLVKTMPYRDNFGYMFAPAHDTWHGLEKKEIKQERRSVLINYVTFQTDWKLPERPARRAVA